MLYIVWTKKEYGDWEKVECGDKPAAERSILDALKQGQEPLLTVSVPYSFNVKMGDIKDVEALISKEAKTPPPASEPKEVKDEATKSKAESH